MGFLFFVLICEVDSAEILVSLWLVWKENEYDVLGYARHMTGIYAFIYLFKLIYYLLYINILKWQMNLQIVKP
jgi:hypothetical protein